MRRPGASWHDLESADLIANPLCEHIHAPELRTALSRARLRIHNTTTLLAMVRAGLGVTVLPELVCRHADPGIAFRELAESVAKRHIDMISRARDIPSPATAAFTDFFASCLTGNDGSLLTNI